ncbi:tetratricopeptide repeat protein [Roseibium sp.]|uniref:tetratricopeptide repeat protein n=1 Tax=Roseibium sp. TaxID=1936156 RepID=UPI003D0C0E06
MKRRLAAILAADVVGYSRLMRADETGTLTRLKALRTGTIDPIISENNGRIVKLMGDGALVEFASVVDAVTCAAQVQRAVAEMNAAVEDLHRILFRIGVNVGDVMIDGDDIYGDGVNIASRLEGLSEAGGICISGTAYEQIRHGTDLVFRDGGEQSVKNIDEPVHAWHWADDRTASVPTGAGADTVPTKADKPSIAVLPFNNMGADGEQEYFADGITEDIITDLSKVSGLFVVARNSTFAYKGQSPDIRRVCQELGVRHVLEGSVRRAGNRVRINAQLIEGTTGGHLWAERYDRNLEDIFAVQDEVTREIVSALQVALTPVEETRRRKRVKVDPGAYDCLVHARTTLFRFSAEATKESQGLLKQAIELDSAVAAAAYSWLSIGYTTEYLNGWNGAGPERLEEARATALRALEADGDEPQAHRALALVEMWRRNYDVAKREVQKAIELDPNYAGGYTTLGQIRDLTGDHQGAIAPLEKALRLDPKYDVARQFLGRAQFALGRLEEAETSFRKRLAEVPQSDMTRVFLVSLCGLTGRIDEAREMWRQLFEINPDFSLERFRKLLPYQDTATTERFLEGLRLAGLTE